MGEPPGAGAEIDVLLKEGRWEHARDACRAALAHADDAGLHEHLGTALWWLGEVGEALRCWEAAYARHVRAGDPVSAASVAVSISLVYGAAVGNPAVARGWVGRAAQQAAGLGAPPLDAWVLVARASSEEDVAGRAALAEEALGIARACGERDAEACAMASLGSALVDEGRAGEGAELLDAALAAALGGEVDSLDTVVFTSCVLMQSCVRGADFARVVQWSHAVEQSFVERYGSPYVHATCRASYGAVLVAIGDWSRAEQELAVAGRLAGVAMHGVQAEVAAYLADLRLAQGRPTDALAVLDAVGDHPLTCAPRAAAHLELGDLGAADALARRRAEAGASAGASAFEVARCRELLGEVALARGEVDVAAAHADALVDGGGGVRPSPLVVARGHRLRGRVAAASGDHAAATEAVERAVALFEELELLWELTRTRVLLAEVLADAGEATRARAEASLLRPVLDALGAAALAERVGRLAAPTSDGAGAAGATTAAAPLALLTRREREVLAVLGEGLTNPEVAERLYISRKTAEHHVASILSKLGLRNRTEAAALAVRHGLVPGGNG